MDQAHRDDQEARGQSLLDEEEFRRSKQTACRHCERGIELDGDRWVDPNATGDDIPWRETCDAHDTFMAEHEPDDGAPGAVEDLSDGACDRLLIALREVDRAGSIALWDVDRVAGRIRLSIAGLGEARFTSDQAQQVANALLSEAEIIGRFGS